eukprot:3098669-Prymnesium_polylepis.1
MFARPRGLGTFTSYWTLPPVSRSLPTSIRSEMWVELYSAVFHGCSLSRRARAGRAPPPPPCRGARAG